MKFADSRREGVRDRNHPGIGEKPSLRRSLRT
jgi:hypothetical protein